MGWFFLNDKIEVPVKIRYDSSNIVVEIETSVSNATFKKELQTWILVREGAVIPHKSDTLHVSGTDHLFLQADNNARTPLGVVLKVEDVFHTFRIQPRVAGASDEAQYLIDQLLATPKVDQEAFETSKSTPASVPHVRIGNLKQQLSRMGVEVKWLPSTKSYEIKTQRVDRERQVF